MSDEVRQLLEDAKPAEIRGFFAFNSDDSVARVVQKFNIWARYFHPRYFTSKDAPFHKQIDEFNTKIYKGQINSFLNVVFRGGAKRQPLDAKILTPNGFKLMGELNVGDFVIGSDGKPTKIEYISPIVNRPIYRIETEDGRSTECDGEHLWTVRKMSNVLKKHVTIDTQRMLDEGLFYKRGDARFPDKEYFEYKWAIETVKPIVFKKKKLPLDPYLVGILLGDGSMSKQWGGARLHFHRDDDTHYRSQLSNYTITGTKYDKRNKKCGRFGISGIGRVIIQLGMNVNCYEKRIPIPYFYGSIAQRKALLEGLMDTDGTNGSHNGCYSLFSSVSEELIDGVVDLVRSLGGKAVKRKRKGCKKMNGKDYWEVSMMFTDYKPFRLPRKLNKCGLATHTWSRIVAITLVGEKLGRCIKVENNDGLYVTDDYLLTHNTTRTKLFIAYAITNDQDHSRKYIKFLSRDNQNSKQAVTDIYNMLIQPRFKSFYPEIFEQTETKREETMQGFTTATGIKIPPELLGQRNVDRFKKNQGLLS